VSGKARCKEVHYSLVTPILPTLDVFRIIGWYFQSISSGRNKMAKIPYVDKDECTSCNVCVDMVSTVFQMDEENKAEVYDPNGASEAEIQDAMDSCPVLCIHWKE